MAVLSAPRSNPATRNFATKLKVRGKPSNVIFSAITPKLSVAMIAVLNPLRRCNLASAAVLPVVPERSRTGQNGQPVFKRKCLLGPPAKGASPLKRDVHRIFTRASQI
ncbi:MAG: hypothetical protein AAFO72_10270 [Pseudomonadota bacterium]